MKPQELFCVGVRLFGVWQIVLGLQESVYFLPSVRSNLRMGESNSFLYMTHALACLVIGSMLLLGGSMLARLLFPEAAVSPAEVANREI